MKQRMLAFLLAFCMIFSMIPANAFASTEATTMPVLPTATVDRLNQEDLTFALNFKADEVTQAQLNYYGNWYADFELSANKDIVLNADYEAEGADDVK